MLNFFHFLFFFIAFSQPIEDNKILVYMYWHAFSIDPHQWYLGHCSQWDQLHSTKKVSSRLTPLIQLKNIILIFPLKKKDIDQVYKQGTCKKNVTLFSNGATRRFIDVFLSWYFNVMHWSTMPIDKKCNFFFFHLKAKR